MPGEPMSAIPFSFHNFFVSLTFFRPLTRWMRASDWSTLVFTIQSDTDVVERRWIAQNSSFDPNIPKKIWKKLLSKNGRLGIFGVKCQNSAKPYNKVLIRKLLGPRKRKKIIKKILRLKVDDWAYLGSNFKTPLDHTNCLIQYEAHSKALGP